MAKFENPILVRTIIEMLGAPKEHIENILREYVEKLKKEKNFEITREVFAEATEQGGLFSTFVELEAEFKDFVALLDFCFDSMPSSVEILSPEEMLLKTGNISDFLNDLQARMHHMDLILKTERSQKRHLDNNAMNVFRNFILYVLKDGPKTKEEIGEAVGVASNQVKSFLDRLIEESAVDLVHGNKYQRLVEKNG